MRVKKIIIGADGCSELQTTDGHIVEFGELPVQEQVAVLNAIARLYHKYNKIAKEK